MIADLSDVHLQIARAVDHEGRLKFRAPDEFAVAIRKALVYCLRKGFIPGLHQDDELRLQSLEICGGLAVKGAVGVDGVDDRPLMLRVAPSTTPSSGLFPRAILIGRTHLGPREVVINAVPFGPKDYDRIQVFAEKVNRAFLPKPAGMRPVARVWSDRPAQTFPAAFDTFRKLLKSIGQNRAAFAMAAGQDAEEFYFAAVWAAIRSGWREGYALQGPSSRRGFELELANVVGEISGSP